MQQQQQVLHKWHLIVIYQEGLWCSSIIPSLQHFEVLHHREAITECYQEMSFPPIPTPRLSALLVQILYHREATIECCPVQLCHAALTPRLQFHLCSLHHSLRNLQLSRFVNLNKANTMGQVFGLVIATQGISQVQLPAPRIDVFSRRASSAGPQWT